jgi:hypothetical protein
VYKNWLLKIFVLVFIFSCNNDTGKKNKSTTDVPIPAQGANQYSNMIVDLSASRNMLNLLCQGWENEDDALALQEIDDNSTIEIAHRSFYLSTDGSFIKNPRNAMDYGRWEYDSVAKTITLHYKVEKGMDVYKIAALAADEMILVNRGISTSTNLKFIASGKRFKEAKDEPFHMSNNQWRVRPYSKETDDQVKQRLKDNLHFFILFYRDAIAKNSKHVSFWGLPSCLKWYAGGIYLVKKEELNPVWIECFYNKDQAMKAYAIMDEVMNKKYSWPKDQRNWVQKNATVLQQMYDNIDQVK